jgi:hypothetical protein
MERQEIIDEDNQIDHHENEMNQPTNVDIVQEQQQQQSNEPDQVNINDDREKKKFSSFLVSYMYNAY